VYTTFGAWVANKRRRVAEAVRLVGGDAALANAVDAVYAEAIALYDGTPRLSKADCAGGNLLVDEAAGVTIIDWEWAQGLDPAADLAYWRRETPDPAAHALLLAAYAPDDPPAFERRIAAHLIFHAVETIHVLAEHDFAFDEHERAEGFRTERQALTQLLRRWPTH